MTKDDDRVKEEFTSEAEELLDALSNDLGEFDAQAKNVRPDVINKIFRHVHSLKGLAAMLGFVQISDLAHNLEDMLDKLRMGRVEISRTLIDLLYDAIDGLNRLVIAIHDPQMEALVDEGYLTRSDLILIVSMMKIFRTFDVPVMQGMPFLIGSQEEKNVLLEKIINVVRSK